MCAAVHTRACTHTQHVRTHTGTHRTHSTQSTHTRTHAHTHTHTHSLSHSHTLTHTHTHTHTHSHTSTQTHSSPPPPPPPRWTCTTTTAASGTQTRTSWCSPCCQSTGARAHTPGAAATPRLRGLWVERPDLGAPYRRAPPLTQCGAVGWGGGPPHHPFNARPHPRPPGRCGSAAAAWSPTGACWTSSAASTLLGCAS